MICVSTTKCRRTFRNNVWGYYYYYYFFKLNKKITNANN